MSWQQRDGKLYYYKTLRIGGRVRCWYFGGGPAGELAALCDLQRRMERLEEQERQRAALARQRTADAALDRLCEATTLLARASLLAAGYHQHDRGEWRKKRVPKTRNRPG